MSDNLIESLVAKLTPVRRQHSPWKRSLGFLGLAFFLMTMLGVLHLGRFSMALPIVNSATMPIFLGALATGVLATLATFMSSQPGRPGVWALLPLPPLAFWLSRIGYQCLTHWVAIGPDGMQLGETAQCFATLAMMALPLGLVLAWVLRPIARVAPPHLVLLASLAVAGLSAAAMNAFHPQDASILILVFNLGSGLVLTLTAKSLEKVGLLSSS